MHARISACTSRLDTLLCSGQGAGAGMVSDEYPVTTGMGDSETGGATWPYHRRSVVDDH